jgi:hypothetical protein
MDVFYNSPRNGRPEERFPYSLTASRINRGQVLFIAGLASPAVYSWPKRQYNLTVNDLNDTNKIAGFHNSVMAPVNARGVGYDEWEQTGKGFQGDFAATTLSAGDVVIWPQGGEDSRLPAWHGFFQIGHPNQSRFEPRESTSYHLGK